MPQLLLSQGMSLSDATLMACVYAHASRTYESMLWRRTDIRSLIVAVGAQATQHCKCVGLQPVIIANHRPGQLADRRHHPV